MNMTGNTILITGTGLKRVLPHRYAAEHGRDNYAAFFKQYDSGVS